MDQFPVEIDRLYLGDAYRRQGPLPERLSCFIIRHHAKFPEAGMSAKEAGERTSPNACAPKFREYKKFSDGEVRSFSRR